MQPLNRLTIVSPSWRLLAALGVLVCVWAGQAPAQSADVHFQVTHADAAHVYADSPGRSVGR